MPEDQKNLPTDEHYEKTRAELKSHLMARDYTEPLVDTQLEKASLTSQMECLQPHPQRPRTKWIPLVITYHPILNRLNKLCKKPLPILHLSDRLQQAIPEPPLIAFCCPRNLKDLLVRTELKSTAPLTPPGNTPCRSRGCKSCKIIQQDISFTHHGTDIQNESSIYV